jgi:two-component sensor histidine kinase
MRLSNWIPYCVLHKVSRKGPIWQDISRVGLVIVNRLLSAMNGTIKIESYSDVGATVEITIPSGKGAAFILAARTAS